MVEFQKIEVSESAVRFNKRLEAVADRIFRGWDAAMGRLRLGGRAAPYDDYNFEFEGGSSDVLRKRHYDKSLRLLWKAESEVPWLPFRDASRLEKSLEEMAERGMSDTEKTARERLSLPQYRELLNREYTTEQKEAIVAILAAIGHGEAYAWIVSSQLLNVVKSTGARAALTMQVLEEAKHFVVLRELLLAFDVPIRRQCAWEYAFMESVVKAEGLEKFFGMNVVVEGIALSLFGMLSNLPGLEVLRLFHLDESRHTGLPGNYLKEFPLTNWQKHNPVARMRRLRIVMPALMLIPYLEKDLAVLGIDAFAFGGSVLRKVGHLAERNGFYLPVPVDGLLLLFERMFNAYCARTRPAHTYQAYMKMDTTRGERERAVEAEIFGAGAMRPATPKAAASR